MVSDSFTQLVSQVASYKKIKVTKEEYDFFKNQWLFDAVCGKRYGQAFCDFFKIDRGTPLYYFKDNKLSERWIQDNYIM